MKRKITITGLLSGLFIATLMSCHKDPDTSVEPQSVQFVSPDTWPVPFYSFANNKLTKDGFELGRKIFYDRRLSKDFTTSCGSCHQSFAGFAQLDHNVSHGVFDLTGNRNSPALANMAWSTSFFWDGGVNNLEIQPLNPIQNPVEMDMKLDSVLARMSKDPDYHERFNKAFGSPDITALGLFKSLAQFMGMMVSANSKYDRYIKGIPGNELSTSEAAGLKVYEQNCAACHKAPLFTDYSFRNNGLSVNPDFNDSGRAKITLKTADLYKFKIPTLRNLGFTRPFMHDGRFRTLEQVLDHYDHQVVVSPTLDPILVNGIKLNTQDRVNLLAFLNTLNDSTFVKDKRFEEPK